MGSKKKAAKGGDRMRNPCIGVCKIDKATGWCRGCWRTKSEIREWKHATEAERTRMLQVIELRRSTAAAPTAADVAVGLARATSAETGPGLLAADPTAADLLSAESTGSDLVSADSAASGLASGAPATSGLAAADSTASGFAAAGSSVAGAAARLPLPPAGPAPLRRYRHRKSGGLYTELHRGLLESDLTPVVIYLAEDGRVWVRPAAQFDDGRFEPI